MTFENSGFSKRGGNHRLVAYRRERDMLAVAEKYGVSLDWLPTSKVKAHPSCARRSGVMLRAIAGA